MANFFEQVTDQLGFGNTDGQDRAIQAQRDAVDTQRQRLDYNKSLMETYAMTASGNLIDNALKYASGLSRDSLIQKDMLQYKVNAQERDAQRQQIMADAGLTGSGIDVQSALMDSNMDFANRNIVYSTADERIANQQMGIGMQLESRRAGYETNINSAYDGISTQQTNLSARESAEAKATSDRFQNTLNQAVNVGKQVLVPGSQLNDAVAGLTGIDGGMTGVLQAGGNYIKDTVTDMYGNVIDNRNNKPKKNPTSVGGVEVV